MSGMLRREFLKFLGLAGLAGTLPGTREAPGELEPVEDFEVLPTPEPRTQAPKAPPPLRGDEPVLEFTSWEIHQHQDPVEYVLPESAGLRQYAVGVAEMSRVRGELTPASVHTARKLLHDAYDGPVRVRPAGRSGRWKEIVLSQAMVSSVEVGRDAASLQVRGEVELVCRGPVEVSE